MEKIYSLIRTSHPQFIPVFTKCQIEKYAMLVTRDGQFADISRIC